MEINIEKIAENYAPKFCEAPVTIDHVQSEPAFGWVDNVKAENDKLKVSFKDVPEEFEKEVNHNPIRNRVQKKITGQSENVKINEMFK